MFPRKHKPSSAGHRLWLTKKAESFSETKESSYAQKTSSKFRLALCLALFLVAWLLFLHCWFPTTHTNKTQFLKDKIHRHDEHDQINTLPLSTTIITANSAASKSSSYTVPTTCNLAVSVYVYDLPPRFNLGLLEDCEHLNIYTNMCPHVANHGLGQPLQDLTPSPSPSDSTTSWYATHQFIGEMIFHARVLNHPCRVSDPNKANLFYIPFYGGLHASSKFREANHTARDELAVDLFDFIHRQPWWRNRNGVDHFLTLGRTAWDFMRTSSGPDFGANILLKLSPVLNMSVLTVERHPWQGSNQFGIPYPSYFHPSTSDEMLTWQNKMRHSSRTHLFSFIGGPRKGLEKAAIRDEIMRQCEKSEMCDLLKCESGASKCHNPWEVLDVMSKSQFCLQAPGDSFTRRSTFDSVLAGCVPVFFSPHTAYTQYVWYLPADLNTFSVYLDEKGEESRRIEEELLKIPKDKVEKMREVIIGMIPKLTYSMPNASHVEFKDAVDIALEALHEHVEGKLRAASYI